MIGREPDLTLLFDMDPDVSHMRAVERDSIDSRFEDFGADLQRAMRAGFLDLAASAPQRFRIIDAARDIESIAQDTLDTVRAHLQ